MRYLVPALLLLCTAPAEASEIPIARFTEAIEQSAPDSRHKYFRYRARAYVEQNRLKEALADLNSSIELNPGLVATRRERGELLMKLGCYKEAVADLDLVIKAGPDELGLYRLRSKACFESGLYERALADANLVLAKLPDDAGCRRIVMESTTALSPQKQIIMQSAPPRRRAATRTADFQDIRPQRRVIILPAETDTVQRRVTRS